MAVAGVDGAPDGWAVVERAANGRLSGYLTPTIAELMTRARGGELGAVAIDMPIGLLDTHPRAADVAARRLLGPRRASLFATPLRCCLDAATYEEARSLSRAAASTAPSKQAWNLMPKIRELRAAVRPGDPVAESHPELAFGRLAGAPMAQPKYRGTGMQARRQVLMSVWGATQYAEVLRSTAAPEVDVADALSLVGTAAHMVAGSAIELGNEVDPQGRRAVIAF